LLWKITIFNGKTHYKWPFSIAMLNYQRVWMVYFMENPMENPIEMDDDWRYPHDWMETTIGLE